MSTSIYPTWALLISITASVGTPLTEMERIQLIQRIEGGDRDAMLEAGSMEDTSFIPILEKFMQARVNSLSNDVAALIYSSEEGCMRPSVSLEGELDQLRARPDMQAAQAALAKLGVKACRQEIIDELVSTNSPVYRFEQRNTSNPIAVRGYRTRAKALEKLGYLGDPATVKYIAPCLYETANPYPRPPGAMDAVRFPRLSTLAVVALKQIVKDGPNTDDVIAWQQWWEQNKDKYP